MKENTQFEDYQGLAIATDMYRALQKCYNAQINCEKAALLQTSMSYALV